MKRYLFNFIVVKENNQNDDKTNIALKYGSNGDDNGDGNVGIHSISKHEREDKN